MTIKPHMSLTLHSCDTIAETFEGVGPDLYNALYNSMSNMKPVGEQIDIEESSPSDAVGLNTPASVWDRFTRQEQIRLNEICERADADDDFPVADHIAMVFVALVKGAVTDDQVNAIRAGAVPNDFYDANEDLARAFEKVIGREPFAHGDGTPEHEADCGVMNAALAAAKY